MVVGLGVGMRVGAGMFVVSFILLYMGLTTPSVVDRQGGDIQEGPDMAFQAGGQFPNRKQILRSSLLGSVTNFGGASWGRRA